MSPALTGSSAIQYCEGSNTIEICDRITFEFTWTATCVKFSISSDDITVTELIRDALATVFPYDTYKLARHCLWEFLLINNHSSFEGHVYMHIGYTAFMYIATKNGWQNEQSYWLVSIFLELQYAYQFFYQ